MNEQKHWREFVEDDRGVGSSTRLCMVYGVFVGGLINCGLACFGKLTGDIFGIFMLSSGGVYGWGKYRESVERVEQTKADSPNQPQVIIPAAPAGPTTTINVGGDPKSKGTTEEDINAGKS